MHTESVIMRKVEIPCIKENRKLFSIDFLLKP